MGVDLQFRFRSESINSARCHCSRSRFSLRYPLLLLGSRCYSAVQGKLSLLAIYSSPLDPSPLAVIFSFFASKKNLFWSDSSVKRLDSGSRRGFSGLVSFTSDTGFDFFFLYRDLNYFLFYLPNFYIYAS